MAAMKKSQRRQKSPRVHAAEVIPAAQPSSVKRKRGHRKKCSILSDRSRRKTDQRVTNRARKEAADAATANAWRQVEAKEAAACANIRERLDEAKLMNRCGTPHQAASNCLVEIINVLGLMNMHDWSYVQVNWQWLVCGMYNPIERYWAILKAHTRRNCRFNIAALERTMLSAVNQDHSDYIKRIFETSLRYVLLYAAGLDDQNAKKLSDAISDARQTVKKVHYSLNVNSGLCDTRGGQHRHRRRRRKRQLQRRSQKRCALMNSRTHIFSAQKESHSSTKQDLRRCIRWSAAAVGPHRGAASAPSWGR